MTRGVELTGLGTDFPAPINPVTSVTTYESSIELCARQGTACKGLNYYAGNGSPRASFKQALAPANVYLGGNRPGTTVNAAADSAVRLTGPGGQSREILQNGDFSSGSLAPWSQYTRQNRGNSYSFGEGKASVMSDANIYSDLNADINIAPLC